MDLAGIYAKVRNIFNLAALKSRDGQIVTVETSFARTIEAEELFPYGFFAKGMEVKAEIPPRMFCFRCVRGGRQRNKF